MNYFRHSGINENNRFLKRRAMSFIELMIAMILFTLLMWPLYQIIQLSLRSTMKTGDRTLAANIASELIELLKNKPFDVLVKLDPATGLKPKMDETDVQAFLNKSFNSKFPVEAGRFIRTVSITPIKTIKTASGEDYAYIQILVTVYWTERSSGQSRGPISLFTLVANENAPLISQ